MTTTETDPSILGLPEQIDREERIKIFCDEYGFVPAGYYELQEAFSLQSFPKSKSGAALHLNEVLRHQTKTKEKYEKEAEELSQQLFMPLDPLLDIDPPAAVRGIVHKYAGFYADAAHGFNALVDLIEGVNNIDYPFRSLREEFGEHPGISYLARHVALDEYGYKGNIHNFDFDPFSANFVLETERDDGVDAYIHRVGDSVRIGDSRRLIPEAAQAQYKRFELWETSLIEARMHNSARAIAERALSEYGSALQ